MDTWAIKMIYGSVGIKDCHYGCWNFQTIDIDYKDASVLFFDSFGLLLVNFESNLFKVLFSEWIEAMT